MSIDVLGCFDGKRLYFSDFHEDFNTWKMSDARYNSDLNFAFVNTSKINFHK